MEHVTPTNTMSGLSEKEAQQRIKQYGKNVFTEKTKWIFFKEFLTSFFNPLTLLLLGASLITAFLGDTTNFLIIFSIVILGGAISFFQHYRAENAAKRLKSKVVLTATVVRDGETREIPVTHVTVGDIIVLSVGDLVPADSQLLDARELSIDESTLTGESYPAEKEVSKEKKGIVFAGTHVITGEAKAMVTTIGMQTELGKLSEKITEAKPQTAFDKELSSFSILIVRLVLTLSVFVFGVNAVFHHDIVSSFLFAVALAVGLTPELMPVIITVSLSRGALRMEEKEVVVKFLPSIQNLGSMDMLCMDKTGTITENNITLSKWEDAEGKENDNILLFAKLNSLFESGFKNPLDHALLAYASTIHTEGYAKVDEIPFDFERKKLSIIVRNKKNETLLITKGAPHKILESLTYYQLSGKKVKITKQKIASLAKRADSLAADGLRVVAVASKTIAKQSSYTHADEQDLTFLGFLLFTDPVKKTVVQTLKQLMSYGVFPKILTGDNMAVAKKTCFDAGISIENVLDGELMHTMSENDLKKQVETTTIFANLNPEQKANIITLLRGNGHVVGFLGDGINDAPPLKAADIGISVNNGSDIAKDVADIILMRKSLAVLTDGVLEGRKTYANTFKYIMMSLSSNFGNMMSVAIASIFLPFLPLLPVQIILIDFLYDLSQIAVPSDDVDVSSIAKPRKWSLAFLKRFTFVFGPLSSLFDLITFGVLLYLLHAAIPIFRTGWFIESFITQTLIIFAIRTYAVPFFKSIPSKALIMSALITIIAGLLTVFTQIGKFFSFVQLPSVFWGILIVEVIFYFTCVELTKLWFYKKYGNQ